MTRYYQIFDKKNGLTMVDTAELGTHYRPSSQDGGQIRSLDCPHDTYCHFSIAGSPAHHRHLHHHLDASVAGHYDRFGSMGALDILRESITILRANLTALMSLMVLLICPVSGLLLSRALLHGQLANKLATHLYGAAASVGLLHYLSLVKSMYEALSNVLLSYMMSAPILVTLWLLAKASIIHIVSCVDGESSITLVASIQAGARSWKRILCTYFWSWLILLGSGAIAAIVFLSIVSLLDAMQFSADLVFLMELALGLFYSVIFAQILVVGNLGTVVSALEQRYGFSAMMRSFQLLKGKIQVALSLFSGTLLGTIMVETLYQYRVLGIPPTNYAINTASRLWEGPLLVFMYSFLMLLDAIMGCVFYFTCKSSTSAGFFNGNHLTDSKELSEV